VSQMLQQPLRARRFKSGRVIMALMLREMSTTYGRSPGGYLWAIVEPIGSIAMITLIIALGLRIRVPSLGTNFPLFFATGVMPFMLYQRTAAKVANSLQFSRALLFYPGVTFVDAILARFLLNVLTQLMVTYIVITGLLLIYDTRAMFEATPVILSLTMAAALGLAIGTLNCYLFSLFPLWNSLWSIITTPLFFMSCILFVLEDLPEYARDVLWWNPLTHITGLMRKGFYPTYDATYASPVFVFSVAGVVLVFGLLLLGRHYRAIINL
jgi:capsular polysaccharide transport system permease protein